MDSEVARRRAESLLAAWNRRDYDAVVDNVSPNVVLVDHIRGRKAEGPAGYVDRYKPTFEAFEDLQGETVSLIVEGNHVAHEVILRGRHTAPLKLSSGAILDPTNEQITMHIATHMDVDETGKPTTIRTYGTRDEIPVIAHAAGSG
jgi:hypothetical protein